MSFRQMVKKHFWFWIILISLLKLWLVSSQNLYALINAIHDDALFVSLANHLIHGNWLGLFNNVTLAKGAFYPIFIALSHYSGFPLLMVQHALYLAATLFFVIVLRNAGMNPVFLLAFFSLLAFNPSTFSIVAQRVIRDYMYASETIIIFAAIFGAFMAFKNQKKMKNWASILGLSLVPFFLTREEGIWIAPAYLMANLFFILFLKKRGSPIVNKTRKMTLLLIPLIILLFGISMVRFKNLYEYGVWVETEFQANYFQAAYGALTRVKHETWRRYIHVPREVRQKIYDISPSFAELKPYLEETLVDSWIRGTASKYERSSWLRSSAGCIHLPIYDDYSSHFIWAFRDAVALAGHYASARSAKQYYLQLSSEVNQACTEGKLDCYPSRETLAPVFHREYLALIFNKFFHALKFVTYFQYRPYQEHPSELRDNADNFTVFAFVTNHSNLMTSPSDVWMEKSEDKDIGAAKLREVKLKLLERIGKGYQILIPFLSVFSFFCFLFCMVRARRHGFSPLLALSIVVLLAFITRLVLLSYIDVSSFHAINDLYNMPSYVLLLTFIGVTIYSAFYKNETTSSI